MNCFRFKRSSALIFSFFLGVILTPASGEAGGTGDHDDNRATTAAKKTETAPVMDGIIIGETLWSQAPVVESFWQTTPDEGQPSTQRTEVRVLYTVDMLYVGVICYDSDPSKIIISDSRRDASLDDTDSFQLILDTFHDHRNGFVFGTNPAGIEYDGQVTNEGQGGGFGGRQSGGSGGGFNINWDGSWDVATHISEHGWSAEFAIPFRTLRYPRKKSQAWGMNFQRNIRRRKEKSYWTKLERQYGIMRLSEAGVLEGLEIPDQRNLKIMPYTLGQANKNVVDDLEAKYDGEIGADVKYSITPGMTLDLTVNTDFAQVEVDEQQINLDRFNLFFPEKRPFFLENSGIFAVGNPGEVDIFFSRRIGIGPDGQAVPIFGGARLSGKVGNAKLGFLNMQTESVGDSVQANNFGVARFIREFPNRTSIGAMFINRQGTGDLAPDEDHNRTFALDGRLGLGQYTQLSGFVAGTSTPGVAGDQHAFRLASQYRSDKWFLMANYTEVGEDFNPEVGFLQRTGYRKPDFLIFHNYRPKDFLGLQEMRPHISYRGFWDFSGFQETGYLHVDNHWEWKNGYEIHTGVNFTKEGVTEDFEIRDGVVVPAGTFDHAEAQIVGFTNRGAPVSYSTRLTIGGFFGGDRVSVSHTLRWRVGETVSSEISWSRNDINLPGGDFITNLVRARLSYSFSPKMFLQGLIQYNNLSDKLSANLRFTWLQSANSGLFLVYNQTSDYNDFNLNTEDRTFVVKYSRLFDVFR